MSLSTDGGVGYRGRATTISYNFDGSPIPAESNIRFIFERFFQDGGQKDIKLRVKELKRKKRVVDLILSESKDLKKKLGVNDRQKLDEYMETLRDLEERVEVLEKWQKIPMKKFNADHIDLSTNQKASIKYLHSMVDLMILAFQTDTTRVASFMIDREESSGKARFFDYGNPHKLSHGKSKDTFLKWSKYDREMLTELKGIINKLRKVKDEHGSLLDNTVVLYGGANSTFHNARNYPMILAGAKKLGFKHGQYLRYGEEVPLSNLYVSILKALNLPAKQFADSTGIMKEVFV